MRGAPTRWLLAVAAGLIVLSCTADRINGPGEGGLRIRFVVDEAASKVPGQIEPDAASRAAVQVDSIRIVIRDARDRTLAARQIGYSGAGDAAFDLSLPAARDLIVLMSGEAASGAGRGSLYFGRQPGISIERGRTTEATLILSRTEAEAPVIEGAPGSSTYLVRWGKVPFASSYTLREVSASGSVDFSIAAGDTARLFTPGVEAGSARLAPSRRVTGSSAWAEAQAHRAGVTRVATGTSSEASREVDVRTYRVRGELPLGSGLFGDSASVDLSTWFDLPRIFEVSPADSATGVRNTSEITIRFDRLMGQGSSLDTLVTLREISSGALIPVTPVWVYQDLTLRPESPLPRGEWLRIRVSAKVEDEGGRPLDQDPSREGLQAFVSDFRVEEYHPLRVVTVTPADGATDLPISQGATLTLLRAVDRSTVTASSFSIVGPSGALAAERSFGPGDSTLAIVPSEDLLYDTPYTIRLETTVLDASRGEPLDQDPSDAVLQPFVSTFRTIAQPAGPSIVSTTPIVGETNHPVYEPAVIVFDSAIRLDTFRPGETVLLQRDLNGLWVNVELRPAPYTSDGRTFTLVPVQGMKRNTAHRLVVRAGPDGVRDADGIAFDHDYTAPGFQDFEGLFTTEQNVRVESSSPVPGASQVPWDVEVSLTFDGPIQSESVTDTTFFLRVGDLTVAGSRWISADLREIRFRPDAPLVGFQTYTILVGTGLKSSRGGSLDQDYSLDGHQPYSSQFTTIEETVPPRVDMVDPPNGSSDVSPGTRVTVVFSEPVRAFLVLDNFYLTQSDSAGVEVPAVVAVAPDNLSADLVPSSPLAPMTAYHVHVDPLVTDLFGNGLDQDPSKPGKQRFHSFFTTEQEKIPPRVLAVSPADGSIDQPADGGVSIEFSEPIDPASVASAIWIGTGGEPHPGAITVEEGGRRLNWAPDSPLHYDSLYQVRADTLLTDLAGNRLDQFQDAEHPGNDPFASSFSTGLDLAGPVLESLTPADGSIGVDPEAAPVLLFNEPLDPLTIGPSGIGLADSLGQSVAIEPVLSTDGREVRLTHALAFAFETLYRITIDPALTDLPGNPFDGDSLAAGSQPLTTTFRTRSESIPPRVVSVAPPDSAAGVAASAVVAITFSEPVDPSSIDAASFELTLLGAAVPGSRSVAPDGLSATLTPDSSLHYATRYEVRVEGVRDLKGNRLDQDPVEAGEQGFGSTFVTGDAPAPSPRVLSISPLDGALEVDPAVHPRIVFSREMDVSTFTAENPGLLKGGFPVPVDRVGEAGDTAFVLTPQGSLSAGVYTWYVSPALKDQQGNPLDQDPALPGTQWFTASFEVGRHPVASAGSGVCSDGGNLTIPFDGRASTDPDGPIALISGLWSWGDGTTTVFSDSSGLQTAHTYPCADLKGCDGVDNDGDGETDETGPGGCDESYRVILSLRDASGLGAADTTGVAFCAFLAQSTDPPDGATEVDTLQTVRVRLTAPCDSLTIDPASIWLQMQGAGSVAISRATEEGRRVLVLDPVASLLPDTTYVIHVTGSLHASTGAAFDQLPCVAGAQDLTVSFRTEQRPIPPPGRSKNPPFTARPPDEEP